VADEDGRRQILAAELANRERRSTWRDFLPGLNPAASPALSLSSATTTPASSRQSARSCRKRPGSVAMWTFRNALDLSAAQGR